MLSRSLTGRHPNASRVALLSQARAVESGSSSRGGSATADWGDERDFSPAPSSGRRPNNCQGERSRARTFDARARTKFGEIVARAQQRIARQQEGFPDDARRISSAGERVSDIVDQHQRQTLLSPWPQK